MDTKIGGSWHESTDLRNHPHKRSSTNRKGEMVPGWVHVLTSSRSHCDMDWTL